MLRTVHSNSSIDIVLGEFFTEVGNQAEPEKNPIQFHSAKPNSIFAQRSKQSSL